MKNLVFTSAGNNTNFDKLWFYKNKINYDIIVYYYEDDEKIFNKYKNISKLIVKNKGSKFQNFYHFYLNYIDVLNEYEYFFILDDDIIFENNYEDINRMFKLAKNYNLDICSPCFTNDGIISHPITLHKQNILLEYTNFIEVCICLFNKKSILKFMKIYDNKLIGWGIDFLYGSIINNNNNIGIFHCIKSRNPTLEEKGITVRENEKVKNFNIEEKIYGDYCIKNNYNERYNIKTFNIIYDLNCNYPFLYINLDRSKDRNKKMIETFSQYNIKNYNRIKGCDGNNLNELKQYSIFNVNEISKKSSADNYKNKYLSHNEMGCFISHLLALKYFVENIKDDYCFICEDDISFDTIPLLKDNFRNYINNFIKNKNYIYNIAPIYSSPSIKNNNVIKGVLNSNSNISIYGTSFLLISKTIAQLIVNYCSYKNKLINFNIIKAAYDMFLISNFKLYIYPLMVNRLENSIITFSENHFNHHKFNRELILKYWGYEESTKKTPKINIFSFLEFYRNKNIIFIPNKGNAGNFILSYCMIQLFNIMNIKYEINCPSKIYKNKILFYGGGANLYKKYKLCKKFIINNHIDNDIVILPHTIYDINLFEYINKSKRLKIICRDEKSYNYVNSIFTIQNNIYLCDDLNLNLTIPKYYLNNYNLEKTLICFRTDIEKTIIPKKNTDISEIIKPKNQTNISIGLIEKIFFHFLNEINKYSIVKTNRLQVAIVATLMNKKVYLYNNSYFKNEEVYNYSLTKFKNLTFVKDNLDI